MQPQRNSSLEQAIAALLNDESCTVQVYDTLPTTNGRLRTMAEQDAPEGTAVLALHQSAGRGRMGRSFYSPQESGLYLSLLLRPQMPLSEALSLTSIAAVAACEAIEQVCAKKVQIKWVNDLLYEKKKICGILTEGAAAPEGNRLSYAIVGIGINLLLPKGGFPPELASVAGALYQGDADVPPADLLPKLTASWLQRFLDYYHQLPHKHYFSVYRDKLCMLGESILVYENGKSRKAAALTIDDAFRLLVRYEDGTEEWRSSGEIRIRYDTPHSGQQIL